MPATSMIDLNMFNLEMRFARKIHDGFSFFLRQGRRGHIGVAEALEMVDYLPIQTITSTGSAMACERSK